MPCQNKCGLPERVTSHLPEHAQGIFREAFKSALEQYPDDVRERLSRGLQGALEGDYNDYHDYDKGKDGPWQRKKA